MVQLLLSMADILHQPLWSCATPRGKETCHPLLRSNEVIDAPQITSFLEIPGWEYKNNSGIINHLAIL